MLDVKILLAYMTDAVVNLNDRLVIRAASDQATLLYRRRTDELVGRALSDRFPELRVSGVLDQLHALREGNVPRKLEIFIPSFFLATLLQLCGSLTCL